ncbi:MAG: glycosyltransferase family 39 protein [Lentisphaeria bacterium]|nr:glycosyltransferase family 39 protein [Lentisphaeria bacterium]
MISKLVNNFLNHRKIWIFLSIAAAGLLLRILYLQQYSREVYSSFAIGADVQEYDLRARELINGIFFPVSPEIHAPLYSWFLALVYRLTDSSVIAVRAIQLVLNWAAYTFIAVILQRLKAPEKLQLIYLALAMFVPVLFFHQGELISESLLAPLFAAYLYFRINAGETRKRKYYALSGIFLGAMILTHGIMTLYAVAEIIREAGKKRFQTAVLLLCGIAIAVLPVVAAKSWHYGKFVWLQGNGAYNFWIGCNPEATGGCYLRPGRQWSEPLEDGKAAAAARGISESRVFLEKSGRFILEQPGKAMLLPLKKICLMLAPWEPLAGADPEDLIRRTPVQRAGSGMFAALLLLALVGIYFAIRKQECAYIHFYILTAAVAVTLILTVVSGRYRQGLMPGVILLAAIGVYHSGKKSLGVILPCLIGGMIFFPLSNAAISGTPEAASIEGEAFYRLGNWEKARHFLLIAEAGSDHPARYDNMLGAIAEKQNDIPEALRRYQRAVDSEPADADSLLNLGHLYFYHFPEKYSEALLLIRAALELNPALPSAYDMLGIHFARQSDFDGALEMFELAHRFDPENELYYNKVKLCRQISAQKRGENVP